MKAALLLLLVSSVTAQVEEDISSRRHNLASRTHGRILLEDETAAPEEDESMSVQLTRSTTKGTTNRATPPNKPTNGNAAVKKQGTASAQTTTEETLPESAGERGRGNGKGGILSGLVATEAPTASPTYIPSYYPTYFPTPGSGKARKVDMSDYDDDTIAPKSKGGKGGSAAGGGGNSKSGKGGAKPSTAPTPAPEVDYCEQAFEKAWELNVKADKPIADSREQMMERCEFDTTDTTESPFAPNLACPFIYTPDTGFLDTTSEVVEFFENITGTNETGLAFAAFQNYCDCKMGLEEECSVTIPDIPPITEDSLDYCIFASIWNGDIALDLLDTLDEEVVKCGCTFVLTEQDEVNMCPGLELGVNYIDPLAS